MRSFSIESSVGLLGMAATLALPCSLNLRATPAGIVRADGITSIVLPPK